MEIIDRFQIVIETIENECTIRNCYEYGKYLISIIGNNFEIYKSLIEILQSHFYLYTEHQFDSFFEYGIFCSDAMFDLCTSISENFSGEDVVTSYCTTEKGTMRGIKYEVAEGKYLLFTKKTKTVLVADEINNKFFFVVPSCYIKKITVSKDNYLFFEHILCKKMIAEGYVLIHAAAIKKDDVGAIIVGKKRSGKTTLLFDFVKRSNISPVSVDKILCKIDKRGEKIQIMGIPTRIRVLAGTLRKYGDVFLDLIPEKYKFASSNVLWEGKSDGKVDISLARFETFSESKFDINVELGCVIFPDINRINKIPKVGIVDSECVLSKIKENVFSPDNPEEDYWSGIGKKRKDEFQDNSTYLCSHISQRIPCVYLQAGEELSKPIATIIHKYLSKIE